MKIFPKDSPPVVVASKAAKKETKISRKKNEVPLKKELSANDIKEKLASHVNTSEASKNMAIKNTKMLGAGFMNDEVRVDPPKVESVAEGVESAVNLEDEIKTPNTKDLTIKSDIALNDPKDSNTQEKLKAVLSRGAFSFNSKEREALEKILS